MVYIEKENKKNNYDYDSDSDDSDDQPQPIHQRPRKKIMEEFYNSDSDDD